MSQFFSSSPHHDGGDSDQTSRPGSSSTPLLKQNYEVFLSFRGEDTRRGFTDYLYQSLDDKGIIVFRDNEELREGKKIDQLLEAIKASKISIPIISTDYASSMWCLKELLQIMECKETSGQLVLPIFYKVKPSDVREQKGVFGKKFRLCRRKHDLDGKLVQDLQNAFKRVASMKGWESDKIADGHEGALVKIVVRRIFNELKKRILSVPDLLVGVDEHIKEVKEKFDGVQSNDAKIIVICGMGGIGKTTLAKALYNEFSESFECQSFIPDIRESSKHKGMERLQKQMISDILVDKSLSEILHVDEGITIIENCFRGKRLLLLLDDVKDKVQLDNLAKKNWFGPESIVIITTRNKNVIESPVVNLEHELDELNGVQSYKLFCKHAFGRDASCPGNLETLARNIVSWIGGLPLAIEVIGSLLCGKDECFWRATKEKLRTTQDSTVHDKPKISYDVLDHTQQQIFLDIACFPDMCGYNVDSEFDSIFGSGIGFATYMWEKCGLYPGEGIYALASLSLIKKNDEDLVVMHDQLEELGRQIVRSENCEIGERSRIWLPWEATEVIEGKQGKGNIQALVLDGNRCKSEQFEGMDKLRFLHLCGVDLIGDSENLFPNLRWFYWSGGSNEEDGDIMGINFNPKKLVILELRGSNITEYWKGWRQMKDLKVLSIIECPELTAIPDLSAVNELEYFRLKNCPELTKIHPSIGRFSKTLKTLIVKGCGALEELPLEVGKMEELRFLDLSENSIKEIPISDGYMQELETLDASSCEELISIPDSIGSLLKLQHLYISSCRSLMKIPESIGKLECLTELYLNCTGVTQLPDSIGYLYNLKELLIHHTPIKCFPTSFGKLSKLQELDLEGCRKLESLSNLPCNLSSLKFHGDSMETLTDISKLTILRHLSYWDLFAKRNKVLNVGKLNQLKSLKVQHSEDRFDLYEGGSGSEEEIEISNPAKEMDMAPENYTLLPDLPSSLVELEVFNCQTLHTLSSLSNWKNLSRLELKDCSELMEINILEGAESLTKSKIEGCGNLSRLGNLSNWKMLTHLVLKGLEKLSDIEGIEKLTSLIELSISGCNPSIKFPDLSMLRNLKDLEIKHAELMEIPWLQELKSLEKLQISSKLLQYLPDLSHLTELWLLDISGCNPSIKFPNLSMPRNLNVLTIKDAELIEIPWLQELKSLWTLQISSKSLQYLPDLTHLTKLFKLDISDCEKLIEIRGIENMKSLKYLSTKGCTALRKLPDLPNVCISSDDWA